MTVAIIFILTDHPPPAGRRISPCVECLKDDGTTGEVVGVSRVVFASQEYQSAQAGDGEQCDTGHRPRYQTVPVLPRGDDGGFAERFLEGRRGS